MLTFKIQIHLSLDLMHSHWLIITISISITAPGSKKEIPTAKTLSRFSNPPIHKKGSGNTQYPFIQTNPFS